MLQKVVNCIFRRTHHPSYPLYSFFQRLKWTWPDSVGNGRTSSTEPEISTMQRSIAATRYDNGVNVHYFHLTIPHQTIHVIHWTFSSFVHSSTNCNCLPTILSWHWYKYRNIYISYSYVTYTFMSILMLGTLSTFIIISIGHWVSTCLTRRLLTRPTICWTIWRAVSLWPSSEAVHLTGLSRLPWIFRLTKDEWPRPMSSYTTQPTNCSK